MASLYNDHLAFIHVPKTGGSWVMHAMLDAGVKVRMMGEGPASHVTWEDMPDRPFRFGFVRNPPDWYRSYWGYVRRADEVSDGDLDKLVLASKDFPDFVHMACREMPGLLSDVYDLFLGPPGAIEFVGHYENLVEDLTTALLQSGEALDWEFSQHQALRRYPRFNVTRDKPDIDPELVEMILASESRAVERFYSGRNDFGSSPADFRLPA